MSQKVIINHMEINASDVHSDMVSRNGKELAKIRFHFQVTHETYHDMTTLLYKNDFIVKVPDKNLEFPAIITNYSTSITNLYEPGTVGDFSLELTEKA
ncbi:DUF3219 family protein [Lentibacillus salicampi]|uniref:DUF3219 family protein n=1 Tax=Lentibacillus salicampi TaxID=175306 RepID=A0A4Y9ABZ0_9BACI|nr:DUF3219 family protein [Lentibacillus salicampi]TFJ92687.1 DUF3219 family protein [Lentibacillus salicampi]